MGTYQSYISIAIGLMLADMIVDMLKGEKAAPVVKKGILCVAVLIVTVVIYMILSHIIYPNLDNETYGGVGNMGKIAIMDVPILIGRCYKRFLEAICICDRNIAKNEYCSMCIGSTFVCIFSMA